MDFRRQQRLGAIRRMNDPERSPPRRRRDPAGKAAYEVDPAALLDKFQQDVPADRRDIRIGAPQQIICQAMGAPTGSESVS